MEEVVADGAMIGAETSLALVARLSWSNFV
jgi:hypothetical protein